MAEFARDLRWEEVPADVQNHIVRCMLDLCAAAIAGSRTRVAQIVVQHALETHGSGTATLIAVTSTSTPAGAALANGFATSALDLDDGYRPTKGHAGAVVFAPVLAAAEQTGCSGAELLTALLVAYEVALRAGLTLHSLHDFYHGSGAWAPVGAAAAAARLLGCDTKQIWHAAGIAEFHAGMTPEIRSVKHASMLKDGIGWGAMVGLAAAQLAARGFTAMPSLFDALPSAIGITATVGDHYLIRDVYFKPYACCRWAQPAVEGALAAARDLGVTGMEVARVRVHTFEAALHLACATPRTTEEAQFSLPWPVASALIDGAVGPAEVLEHRLGDPARRALAGRVEMTLDPELDKAFPDQALAWVEIQASDGRRARSPVVQARGDPQFPLSEDDLLTKFTSLVEPVLGLDRAGRLLHAVKALPGAGGLGQLLDLLRAP